MKKLQDCARLLILLSTAFTCPTTPAQIPEEEIHFLNPADAEAYFALPEYFNRDFFLEEKDKLFNHLHSQPAHVGAKYVAEYFKNFNLYFDRIGMILPPEIAFIWSQVMDPSRLLRNLAKPQTQARWGVIFDEESDSPIGMIDSYYGRMPIKVLGCANCHFGKAYGKIYPGLGNKNIDTARTARFGADLNKLLSKSGVYQRLVGQYSKYPEYNEVQERSQTFFARMHDTKLTNLTQGLVPVGIVKRAFWGDHETPTAKLNRSQVKIPQLWGYHVKRKVGAFNDGFADGKSGGWAIGVELVAKQKPENVFKAPLKEKLIFVEDLFEFFTPPRYPTELKNPSQAQVRRGKQLYDRHCLGCHGSHDRDFNGNPIYENSPPQVISNKIVQTDPDKLEGNTPEFFQQVNSGPLAQDDFVVTNSNYNHDDPGYFAPKLWGIWARFPYLHNASVPTLYDLLSPTSQRPKIFSLRNSGEKYNYDEEKMGLKAPRPAHYKARAMALEDEILRLERKHDRLTFNIQNLGKSIEIRRIQAALRIEQADLRARQFTNNALVTNLKAGLQNPSTKRRIYDIRRVGHKNTGHDFWRDPQNPNKSRLSHEQRISIIEYLKTL